MGGCCWERNPSAQCSVRREKQDSGKPAGRWPALRALTQRAQRKHSAKRFVSADTNLYVTWEPKGKKGRRENQHVRSANPSRPGRLAGKCNSRDSRIFRFLLCLSFNAYWNLCVLWQRVWFSFAFLCGLCVERVRCRSSAGHSFILAFPRVLCGKKVDSPM